MAFENQNDQLHKSLQTRNNSHALITIYRLFRTQWQPEQLIGTVATRATISKHHEYA